MSKNILKALFLLSIVSMVFIGGDVLAATCGPANGQSYYTAPTINLCAPGTASAVSGSGPWAWTCYGWMPRESNRNWNDVAISSTGQYVTAVVFNGQIYTSSDYGTTWTARAVAGEWDMAGMSSSGQYQTSRNGRYIYRSTDYGVTWSSVKDVGDFSLAEGGVNVSSTGQYQIVGANQSFISADYGATWTQIHSGWYGTAISSTGQYVTIATMADSPISVSTDYGATWTSRGPNKTSWWHMDMSDSGQYLTCLAYPNDQIYTSSDYGTTWTARQFSANRGDVEVSSTGQYQITAISNGQIYTSSDYGTTWTAKETNRAWGGVAISADGQHKAAVVYGGQIYISQNDDGSNASCSATLKIDGSCGTAQGHGYQSTSYIDTAAERCAPGGTFTSFTDAGSSWTWSCTGSGGGTTASCSANKVACDTASNLKTFKNIPTNLCTHGTASPSTPILDSNIWYWACTNNPGANAACYTYKTACGSSNGGSFSSPPETNFCKYGAESFVTTNPSTYTWTCTGDDSLPVDCSATRTTSEFSCGDDFTDSRDSQAYSTVQIGDQCWMAENLKATQYTTGEAIVYIDNTSSDNATWTGSSTGAYTVFNHSSNNIGSDTTDITSEQQVIDMYGLLYNGYAANDPRGICPAGWRGSTDNDWKILELYLGMNEADVNIYDAWISSGDVGKKIKSNRTSPTPHPRWNDDATYYGIDSVGFSALPGGFRRVVEGEFINLGYNGYWWSFDGGSSLSRGLAYNHLGIHHHTPGQHMGLSVRCVRDYPTNNKPSIVNGTLEYSVNSSSQVNFTGFSASDLDSDPLTYAWACTGAGTFVDNAVANPVYNAPSYQTTDTCYLLVSDGKEAVVSSPVTVEVNVAAVVNGACGADQGGLSSVPPEINLCSAGSPLSVTTNSTTYTWTCNGSGGGSNANCASNRISFKNPYDINSDESCWFCEHYYDVSGILRDGKLSNGIASLEFRFTTNASDYNYYKLAVGTVNDVNQAMKTDDWLPVSSSETTFSAARVRRSGTDQKEGSNGFLLTYGNGTSAKTYYWWVKLRKPSLAETDWMYGGTLVTPEKAFPIVRVAADKATVTLGTDIQYCTTLVSLTNTADPCYPICWTGTGDPVVDPDNANWKCSVCYNSSNQPVPCTTANNNAFSWVLPEQSGSYMNTTSASSTNPIFRFSATVQNLKPGLAIMGSECAGEGETGTTAPLPKWREVSPF